MDSKWLLLLGGILSLTLYFSQDSKIDEKNNSHTAPSQDIPETIIYDSFTHWKSRHNKTFGAS